MKVWAVSAVLCLQAFLLLCHWFIYHTMIAFWPAFWPLTPAIRPGLSGALLVLSTSFVIAAMLGYRYANGLVAFLYKVAAIWLGMFNFLFWAACLCWASALVVRVASPMAAQSARSFIGLFWFGAAILTSLYGMINARWIRERRVTVELPRLPLSWKGRTALLVSDMHLGNINAAGFSRRIAGIARRLDPSIIFIAGDLYDGSKADPAQVAAPLFAMKPPLGVYFCGGNHEDFGDPTEYEAALRRGGIRVLHNERVSVDELQVVGVSYADSSYPAHMRTFLDGLHLEDGPASVLLNHVPHRLPIVEEAGVSLQLSGHTHGGQVTIEILNQTANFARFVTPYVCGLYRIDGRSCYVTPGIGTIGMPVRLGARPEVSLLRLRKA